MVFNIDDLNERQKNKDSLSLLESLPYIERQFVDPTPVSIPLMELADMKDVHFVRYSDLEQLASVYNISIQEAAREVQDANFLSSHRFVVAMEEWRPLLNPSIINEFPNVLLIKEQGPLSIPYRLCETYLGSYIDTQEPLYLNLYLEAVENESFAKWLLTEAWDGYKGDLDSMKATRNKFYAAHKQVSSIANNANLPMEQRQKATNDMVAIQRSIQSFDDAIAAREKLQTDRKASQQGAIALQQKHGREADHPNSGPLTPEQQRAKVNELKAKRYDQLKNPNNPSAAASQQPEQQGWWARHWAAFKNWMNNLGSSGDQKSTWFTNMIDKVKAKFNGGAQATQTANQQQGQPTQNANQQQQGQTTQQGQSQQGQAAKADGKADANPQSTQNSNGSNRSMVSDVLVDMAAGKGMELGGRAIDKVVGKVNDIAADNLGVDISDLTGIAGEVGKQIMNRKIGQGAEVVKDRGGEVVHDVVDKVKEVGNQAIQKGKDALDHGVLKTTAAIADKTGSK